ncbi:MAG: hypothetical protein ACFFE7_10765 [Candidatus Thorarchaeota archaeon]
MDSAYKNTIAAIFFIFGITIIPVLSDRVIGPREMGLIVGEIVVSVVSGLVVLSAYMTTKSSDDESDEESQSDNIADSAIFCCCLTIILITVLFLIVTTLTGTITDMGGLVVIGVVAGILILVFYACIDLIPEKQSEKHDSEEGENERTPKPGHVLGGHEPVQYYEPDYSDVPHGFRRLVLSRSQKTRMARDDGLPRRPIPGVAMAIREWEYETPDSKTKTQTEKTQEQQVKVTRGGEFVGNRMRFKVKIINDSPYVITDVTVYLLSYPTEALRFSGGNDKVFFPKIEPGGFRSPTFDFMPTQDCVRGEIVAGVSFLDNEGDPKMKNTRPFVIRSVCDLLLPQKIAPQDFELRLKELECGEIVVKIEEWTPEEMFEKALKIVDESNFFEVSSKSDESDGVTHAKIVGFAQGKYTGKEVGVEILITGHSQTKGASCTIRVSGEDQAMILPAIDDLRERLSAWLCPRCSSPLSLSNVEDLREGKVVECPFCEVTIGR